MNVAMAGDSAAEDRRPLQTRSWGVFQTLSASLASRGVTPNAISVSSVGFAIIGAIALTATNWVEPGWGVRLCWLIAAAGIQLRLIANLLDGMVAIEGGKASKTGSLFNEVPDRISDPVLLIAAGYAMQSDPVAGWAAACVALFVAYVRAIAAEAGCGQLFAGPMAKQQRMALLTLVCVAGVLLPSTWLSWGGFSAIQIALWIIVASGIVTAMRRLWMAARILKGEAT